MVNASFHRFPRLFLNVIFVLLLATSLLACGSEDDSINNNDESTFDGNGESACTEAPSPGGACGLADGSFCPFAVSCLCSGPQILACQCVGGQWSCPAADCNEKPPCPVPTMPDVTSADTSEDAADAPTSEDTSGATTEDTSGSSGADDTSGATVEDTSTSSGADDTSGATTEDTSEADTSTSSGGEDTTDGDTTEQ